jgi:hypothetical protein
MITKVCNLKLCYTPKFCGNGKNAQNLNSAQLSPHLSSSDYITDFNNQKRNALRTSFAVIGGSLLFTLAYVFLSVCNNRKI